VGWPAWPRSGCGRVVSLHGSSFGAKTVLVSLLIDRCTTVIRFRLYFATLVQIHLQLEFLKLNSNIRKELSSGKCCDIFGIIGLPDI
jgi:hypothetical protein